MAIATSITAMAISIILIIFFGAWAVSANSEADLGRIVAGAASGFSGDTPGASVQPVASAGSAGVPRLATAPNGSPAAADTWWGKALLGACPLH